MPVKPTSSVYAQQRHTGTRNVVITAVSGLDVVHCNEGPRQQVSVVRWCESGNHLAPAQRATQGATLAQQN